MMGNKNEVNGKILFGVDYLNLATTMEIDGVKSPGDPLSPSEDAAKKLFLLQWGFTTEEIDQANHVFWDKVNNKELDATLEPVISRIKKFIGDDKEELDRLVIELAALGLMDFEVTEDERGFMEMIQTEFDLKPSEFQDLCEKGKQWSIALNYYGDEYMNEKNGKK
jgi:hypothetical protein